MRTRRLPPDHLLPGPPRRARRVHDDDHRRPRALPGAALERQSRRRRRPARRPPLREMARPVPEAHVPLRAGCGRSRRARGQLHDDVGAPRRPRDLLDAGQSRPLHARDGIAEARDALGRGEVRPRIRPRHVHDLLRRRFQPRRDGEQGPQHLQQQARAGPARHRDRRRLPGDRGRDRSRVLPQLDRQPRHVPRLVPAVAEGRAHRVPRPGILERHGLARRRAHRGGRIPAHAPVSGGCGTDGASGAPRRISGDQQFLYRHRVRKRRRSDPHAAHAARSRALPPRHGSLFRAA